MKIRWIFAILMIIAVIGSLYGCGTPTAQPTMQPTTPPVPTATPEPPYNLYIKILDSQSEPLAHAFVEVAGKTVQTGANGTASFNDLPGENVILKISASGYKTVNLTKTIGRGENTMESSLEEDPNGLLEVNACASGEKLLYSEDFQSGLARQWDAVENKTPGWSVEGDPENPVNLVLAARRGAQWAWLGGRDTYNFDNSVWRLRYKYTGAGNSHVNFRFVEGSSMVRRYLIPVNINNINLIRFQPDRQVELGQVGKSSAGEWHLLEIGYFDGEVSIFVDGKKGLNWKDPEPWKGGTINLEPNPEGESVFYYDNLSVCELSAPLTPIPAPKTGYNLAVTLKDSDGKPLVSGEVSLVELGKKDGATQRSDETGKTVWIDLPGPSASVMISVPGYVSLEKKIDLNKGENTLEVPLERDRAGKLVSELCRPEETLPYAEDFQSGSSQGWNDIAQKLKMNIPGISISEDPDKPGNKVLLFQGQSDGEHNEEGQSDLMYGDSVIRYDFKMTGDIHQLLAWHWDEKENGYIAFIYGAKGGGGRMEKCNSPEGGGPCQFVQIAQWNLFVGNGKWHKAEMSYYQGEVQIWMDGKKLVKWTDPQGTKEGRWRLAHDFWKANSSAAYDNFAVCGLKAPFETMPLGQLKQ